MTALSKYSQFMWSSDSFAEPHVPDRQREEEDGHGNGDQVEHGSWLLGADGIDSDHAAGAAGAEGTAGAAGRVKRKVAPPSLPPPWLSTPILPPWACTISLAMASPRPAPPWLPGTWKKRSKTRSRYSSGMPGPESATEKTTPLPSGSTCTATVPPAGVCCNAFCSRLPSASGARAGSASTFGAAGAIATETRMPWSSKAERRGASDISKI